jgi:hypothetical protein
MGDRPRYHESKAQREAWQNPPMEPSDVLDEIEEAYEGLMEVPD